MLRLTIASKELKPRSAQVFGEFQVTDSPKISLFFKILDSTWNEKQKR
jgi:hypothetical protein